MWIVFGRIWYIRVGKSASRNAARQESPDHSFIIKYSIEHQKAASKATYLGETSPEAQADSPPLYAVKSKTAVDECFCIALACSKDVWLVDT